MLSVVLTALALHAGSRPVGVSQRAARAPIARSRMVAIPATGAPAVDVALRPGELEPEDAWIADVDLDAFQRDVMALGRELKAEQGEEDMAHLRKIISWSNLCGVIGVLSVVLPLNPITVLALSTWTMSRWTMIAHHTCHGGYNGQDERFNSRVFAVGSPLARVRDWFDWMLPEAWNVEHNNLHHYRLGEIEDPDLVERNLEMLRGFPVPNFAKRGAVAFLAGVWKWYYYAPNTYKQLKIAEARKAGTPLGDEVDEHAVLVLPSLLSAEDMAASGVSAGDFMKRVFLPYFVTHFFLLPLPFVAAGAALGLPAGALFGNALLNLALADVVSNIHSFIVIATNHAGDDLYRFEKGPARVNTGTWYMRQVVSSANFRTGGDVNDFLHGWLNYQIEHHVRARLARARARGPGAARLRRRGSGARARLLLRLRRRSAASASPPRRARLPRAPQVWPNLSMLSYQKAAPRLRAICEKHGVPYVQESVFDRLEALTKIMIGASSMRVYKPEWEKQDDFVQA